jgi:hypothetical protein
MSDDTLVLRRVDNQIQWYDRHATTARIWYCGIKVLQIVLAASVPVAAGLDLPKLITGSLGGFIVVLEGIQQLYRFHDNWVRYRWTTAAMEREKALWTARAGDYSDTDRPDALLALRVEDLSSREATQWVALQSQADGRQTPDAGVGSDTERGSGTGPGDRGEDAEATAGAAASTAPPATAGAVPASAAPPATPTPAADRAAVSGAVTPPGAGSAVR